MSAGKASSAPELLESAQGRPQWGARLWMLSPLLICVAIMLPRLLSPQFGFMDDARTLVTARQAAGGVWDFGSDPADGRFRPLYWVWNVLLYWVGGPNPLVFLLGNLTLFMLLVLAVIGLARGLGFSRLGAGVAGAALALSGPVLENVYTLSKPELQQALWLAAALLAPGLAARASGRKKQLLWVLAASLAVFLASTTKETGALLLPFALACAAFQWLWTRLAHASAPEQVKSRWIFALAAAPAVVVTLALRQAAHTNALGAGGYAANFTLSAGWILPQIRLWMDWLLRDFYYLIPLSWAAVVWLLRRREAKQAVLFEIGLWMVIWLALYLPWQYVQEYYLLPFTLGAALLTGLLVDVNLWAAGQHWALKWLAAASLASAALCFAVLLPSNYSNGRMQLSIDQANADLVARIASEAPQGAVILINIQNPNEYTNQFPVWFASLRQRPDLLVNYFQFQDPVAQGWQGRALWVVSPFVENQFYPSMRVGVQETNARQWDASLQGYLVSPMQPAETIRYQFRSFNISPLVYSCLRHPGAPQCSLDELVDRRMYAYGWKIYKPR